MKFHSAGHILCMVPLVIVSLGGVVAVTDRYHRYLSDRNRWTGTVLV